MQLFNRILGSIQHESAIDGIQNTVDVLSCLVNSDLAIGLKRYFENFQILVYQLLIGGA